MNIHATYDDPAKCARALDDRRLNKMLTETGQILSTALHLMDLYDPNLFKPFNPGHKINKWVAKSSSNYCWTLQYMKELADEYKYRKDKEQASARLIPILEQAMIEVEDKKEPASKVQEFCNYAKNKSKDLDYTHMQAHDAYKFYMIKRWLSDDKKPKWTRRQPPNFFKSYLDKNNGHIYKN